MLLVHAHPDDETIGSCVTMARYASEGVAVTLLTCTRGEEGEVLVPELAQLGAAHDDELGPHREQELAAAMAVLGVADHRFLGGPGRWRDSGMMGLPTNDRPEAFWRADLVEASAQVCAVVREVRPQVLVTYDSNGGYGHPDHIAISQFTTAAVVCAGDAGYDTHDRSQGNPLPSHRVAKLHYMAWRNDKWDAYQAAFRKLTSMVDGVPGNQIAWTLKVHERTAEKWRHRFRQGPRDGRDGVPNERRAVVRRYDSYSRRQARLKLQDFVS
jgi:N-acetyl-1-D-myo-inositol-2-amino-2-deoxy-alpha-D-glucopyranoside deacetylase